MIKQLRTLLLISIAVAAVACATKKEEDHAEGEADQKEWKEMDDFHMVMAETLHPYKDSANLEPVKSRAGELVSSAETWANSTLPKKVDNDEMKSRLQSLKTETSALVQTITSGDDKAIAEQLTKVHDLFHEIQEAWYGGEKEGHEHH